MGMATVYIREEDFCHGNKASVKVQKPMFHLDKPVLLEKKLRYETRSRPEDLEVAELIYAEVAFYLSIPKKKVLKCVKATTNVIAWALTEGKDFDFVFKNFGILVCRGRRVVMRFFEDLLRDVDKTGILANTALRKSSLRPLVIARNETAVFQMPPGGIFVFPQLVYKSATSEKELADKAAQRGARPAERLLSRGRLSPVRTGGLGVTGEKRGKAGTAAGSVSVLPPIEGTRAEKRKEARATDRPQVWLPPLDSRLGAAEHQVTTSKAGLGKTGAVQIQPAGVEEEDRAQPAAGNSPEGGPLRREEDGAARPQRKARGQRDSIRDVCAVRPSRTTQTCSPALRSRA
ncbi:uncharacterized protein LOC142066568 isoform X2 [Phalacrocorax aristotelis]|uniref:uncharacterized protein LOC142066568 isoform X2 n=1 Tax=Phalacrocorax aristotelis TaxID=126867 RepID=UPI003F4C152F